MQRPGLLVLSVLCVLTLGLPALAQQAEAPPAGERDTQAEVLLRSSCASLAALRSYSFQADVSQDYAYPSGDKVQVSKQIQVFVQRPDRFRSDVEGDDVSSVTVYDGKALTMLDRDKMVYGVVEVSGSTDAVLRNLLEKYDIEAPLANLVYGDPCATVSLEGVTAKYLGLHMAAGRSCHHLAFFGPEQNWQIWVDEADGLPRKLVITDKGLPGWPQFHAVITEWKTARKYPAGFFTFTPPKGARQAPVLPIPTPAQAPAPAPAPAPAQ